MIHSDAHCRLQGIITGFRDNESAPSAHNRDGHICMEASPVRLTDMEVQTLRTQRAQPGPPGRPDTICYLAPIEASEHMST